MVLSIIPSIIIDNFWLNRVALVGMKHSRHDDAVRFRQHLALMVCLTDSHHGRGFRCYLMILAVPFRLLTVGLITVSSAVKSHQQ
jgi:hypothetical protein